MLKVPTKNRIRKRELDGKGGEGYGEVRSTAMTISLTTNTRRIRPPLDFTGMLKGGKKGEDERRNGAGGALPDLDTISWTVHDHDISL